MAIGASFNVSNPNLKPTTPRLIRFEETIKGKTHISGVQWSGTSHAKALESRSFTGYDDQQPKSFKPPSNDDNRGTGFQPVKSMAFQAIRTPSIQTRQSP